MCVYVGVGDIKWFLDHPNHFLIWYLCLTDRFQGEGLIVPPRSGPHPLVQGRWNILTDGSTKSTHSVRRGKVVPPGDLGAFAATKSL